MRYPEVEVALIGHDTNAMAIVGTVVDALKRHLRAEGVVRAEVNAIIAEFRDEAYSGDYNHVLSTVMEWVEIADDDDE